MTADKDGWIEWKGGKCPVNRGTWVDVRFSDGSTATRKAETLTWPHHVSRLAIANIVAYRIAKGWIDWRGGECPVSEGTLVEVRIHGVPEDQLPVQADSWDWSWGGREHVAVGCITAYRVVEASPLDQAGLGDSQEMLTFGSLAKQDGNTDANGEGKQTNPKDMIGAKKVPLSTLPFRVLWRVGLAMLEGMCKYGRHNYRAAGVRASVYFDAVVSRHLGAWWEGEDIDADSGLNHIDKAIAGLMVMRDSMLEGNFVDDRPPRAANDLAELNDMAGKIIARHADKSPRHFTIADSKEAA